MDEQAAFIRQICERPEDNTVRLVYADWLDDRGRQPERANFIRLQIALSYRDPQYVLDASMNHKVYENSAIPEVKAAYDALRNFSARDVIEKRPSLLPLHLWGCVGWKRGFISHMGVPCDEFRKRTIELFEQHPIETVKLTDKGSDFGGIGSGWRSSPDNAGLTMRTWRDYLPWNLWQMLDGYRHNNEWYKFYNATADADAALSRVCVRYGRQLAGLPTLTSPKRQPA